MLEDINPIYKLTKTLCGDRLTGVVVVIVSVNSLTLVQLDASSAPSTYHGSFFFFSFYSFSPSNNRHHKKPLSPTVRHTEY